MTKEVVEPGKVSSGTIRPVIPGTPPDGFADAPFVPSLGEAREGFSITPSEALTALVNHPRGGSAAVREALRRVRDMEESDGAVDFRKIVKQVEREMDTDED